MTQKILIVGAGWYGCYIAYKLKQSGIMVHVIEKNPEIMMGASTHNQNRLHRGFHYMRSYRTRNECMRGYKQFMTEFSFLTHVVPCNLYIIDKRSMIDSGSIRSILDQEGIPYEPYPLENVESFLNVTRIESILRTDERVIDAKLSKEFFEKELRDTVSCNCDYKVHLCDTTRVLAFQNRREKFDWVIYCTFDDNARKERITDCHTEHCISFVYECTAPLFDKGLTVIDGPFFSLYPYFDSYYTLTHVTHTVITPSEEKLDISELIQKKREYMEADILELFPCFSSYFTYIDFFISTKTKKADIGTADRSMECSVDDTQRSISVSGGKITGIFDAYDKIMACLENSKSTALPPVTLLPNCMLF